MALKVILVNNLFNNNTFLWSEFWSQVTLESLHRNIFFSILSSFPSMGYIPCECYILQSMELWSTFNGSGGDPQNHSLQNKVWLTISLATEQWKPKAQA